MKMSAMGEEGAKRVVTCGPCLRGRIIPHQGSPQGHRKCIHLDIIRSKGVLLAIHEVVNDQLKVGEGFVVGYREDILQIE